MMLQFGPDGLTAEPLEAIAAGDRAIQRVIGMAGGSRFVFVELMKRLYGSKSSTDRGGSSVPPSMLLTDEEVELIADQFYYPDTGLRGQP